MCKLKIPVPITPARINSPFERMIRRNAIRDLDAKIQRSPRRYKSYPLALGCHNRRQNTMKRKPLPCIRKHKKRYALGRFSSDVRKTIVRIHADR